MEPTLTPGIITFHRAANYGAMLQCFALKKTLQDMGYESAQVIDYRPPAIERCYTYKWNSAFKSLSLSPRNLKSTIGQFAYIFMSKRRLRRFRKFEKNYLMPSQLPYDHYGVIVFGSDQIWNVGITQNDDTFFGDLGTDNVRKISYAGSLGHGDVEAFRSKADLLEQFEALGVRETSLTPLLKSMGLESFTCLDPTLLLTSESWLKYLKLPEKKTKRKPTLLIYSIRDKARTLNAARSVAAQMGLDLMLLEANDMINIHSIRNKTSYYGPREFVRCFNEADYVITDSFHGTVFSILFHKPFVSCRLDDGRDGRAESLLSQLGLKFLLQSPEQIFNGSFDNIEFNICEKKLSRLRNESIRHLSESINTPAN